MLWYKLDGGFPSNRIYKDYLKYYNMLREALDGCIIIWMSSFHMLEYIILY